MYIEHQVKLAGEFRLVVNNSSGVKLDTGWFSNLILNQGMDRMGDSTGGSGSIFDFCRVGTGSSTPIETQTSLDSQIAASASFTGYATSSTNIGAPTYETLNTYTCTFAQGSVVGDITEVGMGWATSGTTLFSRALILNVQGDPVALPIVSQDQLTVFYRLKFIPSLADFSGSVNLSSVIYNYTSRVHSVGSFSGPYVMGGSGIFNKPNGVATYAAGASLGDITAAGPVGTVSGGNSIGFDFTISQSPYVLGTYYRDGTYSWTIGGGNATGGIGAISHRWGQPYENFKYQTVFATPIPKDSTKVMSLTFRYSWARA